MTKNIQKYFASRPKADVLFVVDGIVFIDQQQAVDYASMFGLVVETHRRGDQETGETETLTVEEIAPENEETADVEESKNTEAEAAEATVEIESPAAVEAVETPVTKKTPAKKRK